MQEPRTVLILSQSGEARKLIRRALGLSSDLRVIDARDVGPEVIPSVRSLLPGVIILDGAWGHKPDIDFISAIASVVPASVIMLVARDDDMDYVQQALLAGARGFVTQSTAESDLVEAVHRVLQLESTRRLRQVEGEETRAPASAREGSVISVFSAKGGVGCTVTAVNLAVALRKQTERSVSLFDCDLYFGNVAVLLNLWPEASLGDLVPYGEDLSTELVEEVMLTHSSGVRVLLPPAAFEAAEEITLPLVTRILEVLRSRYEFTVVDVGAHLDPIALSILDASSKIVLVTTPEVPALHNLRRVVQLAEDLGYPRGKVVIVGNRFSVAWGIQAPDIADSLGYPVSVALPSDGRLVTQAANRGVPFVVDAPSSGPARAIYELAELLVSSDPLAPDEGGPRSDSGWFLTRLQRRP